MADGVNLFDLAARVTADTAQSDKALTGNQQRVIALAKEYQHLDTKASKSLKSVGANTLSLEQQLKSVASLDRQRTAAKLRDFLATEKATQRAAAVAAKAATEYKGLSGVFHGLTSATQTLNGPLGGVSSRLSSIVSLGAGVSSSAGAIGIAVGALAVITAGAAVGIYKLVTASAEVTGHLHDLSAQTGFTVETLSALQNLAETSGGSLDSVSSALFIFETKMGEAKEKGSEMSKMFKALSIDTSNNEKALRQAFIALQSMTDAEVKATVGKKLFGRSVKDLLGALEEAGGDFDVFIAKLRGEGLLVTGEMAKRGDQLSDSVTRIGQRLSATGRVAADEFEPMVTSALSRFSSWLKDNQAELKKAAHDLATVTNWVVNLAKVIADASPMIAIVRVVRQFDDIFPASSGQGAPPGMALPGGLLTPPGYGPGGKWNDPGEYVSPGAATPAQKSGKYGNLLQNLGRGGGGGGGGGGDTAAMAKRLAALRLAAVLDGLKQEEDANRRSLDRQWVDFNGYADRYVATEGRRHKAVVDGLAVEMAAAEKVKGVQQKQIAVQEVLNRQAAEEATHEKNRAKPLDERAKLLDQLNDFLNRQTQEIADARSGTNQYEIAARELEYALRKAGFSEIEKWRATLQSNAATQQALSLTRQRIALESTLIGRQERPRWADPKNFLRNQGGEPSEGDETRRRKALDISDETRAKLQALSQDISSTISSSIRTGFEEGAAAGFQSLLKGFLDTLARMAEQWLASSIFKMLSGEGSQGSSGSGSGGGGGFFGFLSKWVLPLVGAAVGGALSGGGGGGGGSHSSAPAHSTSGPTLTPHSGGGWAIGSHAAGLDYVPFDNYPALLHKGERVVPAAENRSSGGNTYHITQNIHVPNMEAAGSRATQRQSLRKLTDAIKHVELSG